MFVLVITQRSAIGELVRQALGAEGWWVTAVGDRETAVRSASDQAPQLVVVDAAIEEAGELVRFFARANGGPGVVVLGGAEGIPDEIEVAEILAAEPESDDLVAAARRIVDEPETSTQGLPAPGQVLNAQDIFGDLLEEMAESPESSVADSVATASAPYPRETAEFDPSTIPVPEPPPFLTADEPEVGELEIADPSAEIAHAPEAVEEQTAAPPDPEPVPTRVPPPDPMPARAPNPSAELSVRERLAAATGREKVRETEPEPPSEDQPDDRSERAVVESLEPSPTADAHAGEEASPEPESSGDDLPAERVERPSRRIGGLPGGKRFWLGMAAGLAVFVATSFLLDRFFPNAPVEPEAAVTAPTLLGDVDLEEMVDREMAEREAELRESLLEEERRLQSELDELEDDGE